jgi:DNA-directed RNA polymerase beta' subunit
VDREGDKGEFMLFNSVREAMLAFDHGQDHMHTRIFVRLDRTQWCRRKEPRRCRSSMNPGSGGRRSASARIRNTSASRVPAKFNGRSFLTTVGRCIFNDILPKAMPFYNYALTSAGQSRVIADTYAQLGRPATIKLLDDMKSLGFKRSTLAGLSFGITDIRTPDSKATILEEGQKKADKIEKATAWAPSPIRSGMPS